MNLTKPQLIIIGSVLFVIMLFIGIFTGILPGTRNIGDKAPDVKLTIWGIDRPSFFQENMVLYETLRPNVKVDYEEMNQLTFEQDIINALAAGKGPDIIMFHSSWLPKHFNKIIPVKETQLTLKSLQETFPAAIEQNFAPSGQIYALPLYIDTLALIYNQDTFDKAGVAVLPKDWLDFQKLVEKLRKKDESGKLTKPAAAIGGSNESIDKGADLLALLMLQAGTRMISEDFSQATFASNVEGTMPGIEALNFYTKFTDPRDEAYTWNDNVGNSLDSFSKGDTAMIFNYAAIRPVIKEKNPFISFKAAPMPQPTASEKDINYSDYWGLAATNNSRNPDWAWDLILYFTANPDAAEIYLKTSNRPPALRALIEKYSDHPELGVFAKQALTARSWPQIDINKISQIFSEMIKAVITGKLDSTAALGQGEREVTELMRTWR